MDMEDLCVLSVNWGEQDVKYEFQHYFMHTLALMRIKTQLCRNTFFFCSSHKKMCWQNTDTNTQFVTQEKPHCLISP